jgi:hypothetical protein
MIIRFMAIIVGGLAVIAPAAHLFELPGKILMSEGDYFVVQRIYLGWWIVGLLLPAAFVLNLILVFSARGNQTAFWSALVAAGLIVLNLAIFTIWTRRANVATQNWSIRPDNWQMLRLQWEYSHAINAGVTLLAFCATTFAALRASG